MSHRGTEGTEKSNPHLLELGFRADLIVDDAVIVEIKSFD